MNAAYKHELRKQLAKAFEAAPEVRKVVVFGSFLDRESPNDMDVAVFQDSDDAYLSLALKYRRMAKPVSDRIPLDIIPVRAGAAGPIMDEIDKGRGHL